MLRCVAKLTSVPAEVTGQDVSQLREVGFSDADILAVCEVVSYYA